MVHLSHFYAGGACAEAPLGNFGEIITRISQQTWQVCEV
jgi:hypothetical protein